MVVRITKPAFNLRDKLSDVDYGVLPLEKVNPGGIIQQKYHYSDVSGGNEAETSSESWQNSIYYQFYFTPRQHDSMILINWLGRSRIRKFGNTGSKFRTFRYDSDDDQGVFLADGDNVHYFGASSSESASSYPLGYWYTYFSWMDFDNLHGTRTYKYSIQFRRTGGDGTVRVGENSAHGQLNAIVTEYKR